MDLSELDNKSIALVVWGKDDQGEDDVAVFTGIMKVENGELYFHRDNEEVHFEMPFDDLDRIKPVPSDLKDTMLNCEYFVNLTIVPYPENENPDDFKITGLKWPE